MFAFTMPVAGAILFSILALSEPAARHHRQQRYPPWRPPAGLAAHRASAATARTGHLHRHASSLTALMTCRLGDATTQVEPASQPAVQGSGPPRLPAPARQLPRHPPALRAGHCPRPPVGHWLQGTAGPPQQLGLLPQQLGLLL
jgi:hypothetical protein